VCTIAGSSSFAKSVESTLRPIGFIPEALDHFGKAVDMEPEDPRFRSNLAAVLRQLGRLDEAVEHYRKLTYSDPARGDAHYALGGIFMKQGLEAQAIVEYRQALEYCPNWPEAASNLAWILATSPNDAVRDGTEAVRFAEIARSLSGNDHPLILDTVAAAYAEMGRFEEAADVERKALERANGMGDRSLVKEMQYRLQLFMTSHPYRERSNQATEVNIRASQ